MTGEPRLRVDQRAALGLGLRAQEMKVERHEAFGQRQRRPILARMRQCAKRRAHGTGHDRVHAKVRAVFPLVREDRVASAERPDLAAAYAPQYARGSSPRASSVNSTHASGAAESSGSADRVNAIARSKVHAQHLLPGIERLVLDRPERAQERRRVHEAVEPAELRANRACDVAEIVRRCSARDRAEGSSAADGPRRRSRRRAPRACARRARAGRPSRRALAQASDNALPRPPDAPVTRIARPDRSTAAVFQWRAGASKAAHSESDSGRRSVRIIADCDVRRARRRRLRIAQAGSASYNFMLAVGV